MAAAEHVHFEDTDETEHSNDILVKTSSAGSGRPAFEIHLGFLQVFHVYQVQFTVPVQVGPAVVVTVKQPPVPNLNCRVMELKPHVGYVSHMLKLFKVFKKFFEYSF